MARRIVKDDAGETTETLDEQVEQAVTKEEIRKAIGEETTIRTQKIPIQNIPPGEKFPSTKNRMTVRVVWGEEMLTPVRFHTCAVGPFEITATVPEGENPMQVVARLTEQLNAFAVKERERKLKEFIPLCTVEKTSKG